MIASSAHRHLPPWSPTAAVLLLVALYGLGPAACGADGSTAAGADGADTSQVSGSASDDDAAGAPGRPQADASGSTQGGVPDTADQTDSATLPGEEADSSDPGLDLSDAAGPQDPVDAAPPAPVTCPGAEQPSHTLVIRPYLQHATPTSTWILWETEAGEESRVDWGLAAEPLDRTTCGGLDLLIDGIELGKGTFVHEVELTGLEPGTRYQYRVRTGEVVDGPYVFQTLPAPEDEASIRIVATSDMQRDDDRPEIFDELIADGVVPFLAAEFGPDLPTVLDAMLIPGDLVDNGWIYEEWEVDFFAAAAEVLSAVPVYPVAGNHEGASFYYFRYFHLPDNGEDEIWYHTDLSNVRLIGLDSNGYKGQEQLDWLDQVLAATCDAEATDFVVAQLHHPYQSELWTPGNTDWTGDVITRLETFSTDCGKPSVLLFGHTHAYSRGQSRDHQHLMVNVASGGGRLDRWGEQEQEDYEEFTVSEDQYGFVLLEIDAGNDPAIRLRRVSRGTPEEPFDNVVSDEITIRRYGAPPAAPSALSPVDATLCTGDAITFAATDFQDPDSDAHQASEWQLLADCDLDATPTASSWRQDRNLYANVDSQAGDDLRDETVAGPGAPGDYCWRVRYRDATLRWSDWSAPAAVTIGACD